MAQHANDASQWLPAARAGSREALGQAFEECRRYLLRIAEQKLDSELKAKGGASDLVQLTFLEGHRDFAQFHGDTEGELRAWLRRLLANNLASFTERYRATAKRHVQREVALEAGGSSNFPAERLYAAVASPSAQAMAHEQR
jgi:RNA polymerase sigma-70 factor (subfamily 1)